LDSVQYKPTGDDIARFIETITPKMITVFQGKPGPNLSTLRNTIWNVASGLSFKHNFTLTRQEARRIDTVLDALVKEGKVTTGTWRTRQRIGLLLLCTIGEAWFTRSLTSGCLSWDPIISRFLSISLMAATACRAGDITRSRGYRGVEYLHWEHIDLVLDSDTPDIDRMVARITLAFEKGSKYADTPPPPTLPPSCSSPPPFHCSPQSRPRVWY
jgi:hypothetical protein